MSQLPSGVNRRDMLKQCAAIAAVGSRCPNLAGQEPIRQNWHSRVTVYLANLARSDHGYAWEDQQESHLTPTYAAVGCLNLLKALPDDTKTLEAFVRANHPAAWKGLEQEHREFELQQIQTLQWLNADASDFAEKVRSWKEPVPYLPQYEKHRYPVFRFQVTAFTCRALLGLPLDDLSPKFLAYLDERRRTNGSFNNTPASQGGDGNVLNTLWGLQALHSLERTQELASETIAWLHACQGTQGGFRRCPQPTYAIQEDLVYTWAAVRALSMLQSSPQDIGSVIQAIHRCASSDGGFGDRPGWPSNPVATYYAIDALSTLGVLDHPLSVSHSPRVAVSNPADDLRVFTCQIESHGQGSPADAVRVADSLKIHLWGAKNAEPGWLDAAQRLADEQGVSVTFFRANEEYGTWVDVPGMGTYSHTSDVMAPAKGDIGDSLAGQGDVSWPEFRRSRLSPLQQGNGRLVWQFGENEELTRIFLDDSIERGGFAAISTFHFGNPDFTNSEPFLKRYQGQLPFIALQDAHGPEPWWFADKTTGFRTLFLAKEPTWQDWLTALKNCWTAPVRCDELTKNQLRMHPGSKLVADMVMKHKDQWQWWDNATISRPLVSLVAVRPEDRYETARPDTGINLRVRWGHHHTAHGQLKAPLAEFISLSVDGKQVIPRLVERHGGRGNKLADRYYLWEMPTLEPGSHQATATVRSLESNQEISQLIEFRAS
ncbi:prenyltransferase/squalene oxidase repeat-containing protein [Bremerella sp. JC770]|uniref:prenyltransferase/squalene oxidase repeat-containing protein n=1 Tax=Bremerella sp. JC770 TaxID=3232137 RepID=UPI003457CDB3